MNTTRTLRKHNPHINSIEYLITTGLGYCCENFFWRLYFDVPSDLIAARLGVDYEAVRRHKKRFHAGGYECTGRGCCLSLRIKDLYVPTS